MTMAKEKLFHQDGDDVREYTDAEYSQRDVDLADAKRVADEVAVKQTAKSELLAKLGISADEAKLLLS
jgi:hypothetical protein